MRTLVCLVAVGLVGSLGCDQSEKQQPAPRGTASTAAPEATAPSLAPAADAGPSSEQRRAASASPVSRVSGAALVEALSSAGRRGTLVNAWASWCGPCRREIPMLVSMRQNLLAQGIDVVFVSVDEEDSTEAALSFAQEHGLELPILIAERPLGPFKTALNPRWPGMLPATFLFDGEGRLRYFWGGPAFENEILPVVEGFLAGKDIDGEARLGVAPGKDYRSGD